MPSSKDSFQAPTAQAKPKSQCSVAVIIISEECHIFSWSASPLEFLKKWNRNDGDGSSSIQLF